MGSGPLSQIETSVTFVWYGGVAGEGLRSVGEEALPSSKSVCSILPIARHLRAGVLRGPGPYNPPGRAGAPTLARPSLRPTPTPQGGSYVQFSVAYIRNMIPTGARLPCRRSWAVWAGPVPNFAMKLSEKPRKR